MYYVYKNKECVNSAPTYVAAMKLADMMFDRTREYVYVVDEKQTVVYEIKEKD